MWLVFTDLDGTLLDHDTYSFQPALPALERLRKRGIPLMFVTSKTRAEVERWREATGNTHPFIVENGGAVFVPEGYFPFAVPSGAHREGYEVMELGDRYEDLVESLLEASRQTQCPVAAFHAMTDEQVAARCQLPVDEAALARKREYDEAFEILDESKSGALLKAIEARGKRWTRGGRFHHILGASGKAAAVQRLTGLFVEQHGSVRSLGLGDGLNDAAFLNVVDEPVLIRSRFAEELQRAVPRGRLTRRPGPEGWNEAVLEVIQD